METKDLEIGKAYKMKWVDSCGTPAGWIDLSEEKYPTDIMTIESYGVLINKSDNAVVLAQSYNKGNGVNIIEQAMGVVTIPIVCITEFEEITFSSVSCQQPV